MRATPAVLLFEPDPELRDVLQIILAEEALEVVTCSSLGDVLARAEGLPRAVAVVDVWCRGDSALLEHARERLRLIGSFVPLVVITDEAWASTARPDDVGAVAVLPKPFGVEAMLSALESAAWASTRELAGGIQAAAEARLA